MHGLADIEAQKEADLRKDLIDAGEARDYWQEMVAGIRSIFAPLPEDIASAIAGKPAVDVELCARKVVYRALNEASSMGDEK